MKPTLILASFNSGSTYLQRALTFWVHELLDNRIRNPHELLNGIGWHDGYLIKQWCDVNHQSVLELMDILSANYQPIVLRLAYDHCLLRQDQSELEKLYDFLNNNFKVYFTRRDNVFDYGMCYGIRRQTNRPFEKQINNVYSPKERHGIYNNMLFKVLPEDVISQAKKYVSYISWVKQNFAKAQPINYEDIEEDIDLVLHNMTNSQHTIKNKYEMSISQYTLVQYERSKQMQDPNYITRFKDHHYSLADQISERLIYMCNQKIMIDPIPIKSTTILDKINLIENFDQCLYEFNLWAKTSGIVSDINEDWLHHEKKRAAVLYHEK